MNQRNPRNPNVEDVISFVRNVIEERRDRATYNSIKSQYLQVFTSASFNRHKNIIQKLCKDRVARKKGKELTEPTKKQVRTGLMVLTSEDTEILWLQWMCVKNNSECLDRRRNKMSYSNILKDQLGAEFAQSFDTQFHSNPQNDTTETETETAVNLNSNHSPIKEGDQVFAQRFVTRSYTGTRYVPGVIVQVNANETYHVKFHDQDTPEDVAVEKQHLRRHSDSTSYTQGEMKDGNSNSSVLPMVWFGSTWKSEDQWCATYGQHCLASAKRVTNVISILYRSTADSNPLLPSLIGVMLNVLPEETVFVLACRLIESSNTYLITAHTQQTPKSVVPVSMALIEKYGGKKLHDHLFMWLNMDILWDMFHHLLTNTQMNMYSSTRLMDVYFKEGNKILYRFIVAIILKNADKVMSCKSGNEMSDLLLSSCENIGEGGYMEIARQAFRLNNLKRSFIQKLTVKYNQEEYVWKPPVRSSNNSNSNSNSNSKKKTMIRSTSSRTAGSMCVVGTVGLLGSDPANLRRIQQYLPPTHQHYDLKLLFTSSEDGCRLDTLYTRAPSDLDGTSSLLIVRPANENCLIGFMLSCSWRPTNEQVDRRNPQCVMFRLQEDDCSAAWNVNYDEKKADVATREYMLTVDQRIVNATKEFLQIGVSSTAKVSDSGLYLDKKLNVGYAGACDVFNGGRVHGKDGEDSKFSVGVVELYGLGNFRN